MRLQYIRPIFSITAAIFLCILMSGCKKYLEKKPVLSYTVPSGLVDLQSMLDQVSLMNRLGIELGEVGCDDYYARTTEYFTSQQWDQLSYIWDQKAGTNDNFSWNNPYKTVNIANTVLDQLELINYNLKDSVQYNAIKGSALFYRSFYFYELAQVYSLPYADKNKSGLGIVLRTTSAIEQKTKRATIQETYAKIIQDAKEALTVLPVTTLYPTRPSKAAAYGLLARTYLSMRDYVNAGYYANQCLLLNNSLMNYNALTPGAIPHFNSETIYYNFGSSSSNVYRGSRGKVDTTLYNSYTANDLRKTVFFRNNGDNTFRFYGSYDADFNNEGMFDGITTDEMYLIRAEAAARAGNKDAALTDLNNLLQTRWKAGTFIPFNAATAADVLSLVLIERRKELTHRGLRWTDVRRLNEEGANITITRIINGVTYTLPPNDLRWAYLLPQYVIDHSELIQNPR